MTMQGALLVFNVCGDFGTLVGARTNTMRRALVHALKGAVEMEEEEYSYIIIGVLCSGGFRALCYHKHRELSTIGMSLIRK